MSPPLVPLKDPFLYYTGAIFPRTYSPLGAWVRYCRNPMEVRVVDRGPGWVQIACPDRDLLLVRNALTIGADRPLDGGWDEFVSFSPSNTSSAGFAYDRYMINYFQHLTKSRGDKDRQGLVDFGICPNLRWSESWVRDNKTIISDSGGFQLLTGKSDWIDPVDLGRFYAANCDEGITLDIPPPSKVVLDPSFYERSAEVQRINSRIILEQVPASFKLFNVVQGVTPEIGKRFRAEVERDWQAPGLCVGGIYQGSIMSAIGRLIGHVLDPNACPYQQYHILGVYNVAMLIPIIRFCCLARQRGATWSISSDASTAVYSATSRTAHLQRAHYKNAERLGLGRSKPTQPVIPNPHRHIACGCPVCTTLKYTDIFSHVDDAIVAHILITHNQLEIDRWVKSMVWHATHLKAADFAELIRKQTDGSKSIQTSLRFVEAVIEVGYEAAMREFAPWMTTMLSAQEWKQQFDELDAASQQTVADSEDAEVYDRSQEPDHERAWWENRLNFILHRYEVYQDSGVKPADVAAAASGVRTAPKVQMNTSSGKAGVRKHKQPKKKAAAPVQPVNPVKKKAGWMPASTHAKKKAGAPSMTALKAAAVKAKRAQQRADKAKIRAATKQAKPVKQSKAKPAKQAAKKRS